MDLEAFDSIVNRLEPNTSLSVDEYVIRRFGDSDEIISPLGRAKVLASEPRVVTITGPFGSTSNNWSHILDCNELFRDIVEGCTLAIVTNGLDSSREEEHQKEPMENANMNYSSFDEFNDFAKVVAADLACLVHENDPYVFEQYGMGIMRNGNTIYIAREMPTQDNEKSVIKQDIGIEINVQGIVAVHLYMIPYRVRDIEDVIRYKKAIDYVLSQYVKMHDELRAKALSYL